MTTTAGNFQHPPTPPAIPTEATLTGGAATQLYAVPDHQSEIVRELYTAAPPLVAKDEWKMVGHYCGFCRTIHVPHTASLEDAA